MDRVTLIGIDPGVVHTGIVSISLLPDDPATGITASVAVQSHVVNGLNADDVVSWLTSKHPQWSTRRIYVEAYRDRGNSFGEGKEMRAFETQIKGRLGCTVLDNTGVKQVVTKELMDLFGVWQFSVSTHHQDLRSAARIALYGGMKDETINARLTRVVISRLGLTTTERKVSYA